MAQAIKAAAKHPSAARGTQAGEPLDRPQQLFISELADVYYAEKALEKALRTQSTEAADRQLKEGFQTHLKETQKHASNLEAVFEQLGESPKARPCPGIDGINQEHDEFMAENDSSPLIRDLFLAGAAARAEHYEIAAYTNLITMSRGLRKTKVTRLLQENLNEEKSALRKVEAVSKRLANSSNGSTPRSRKAPPKPRSTTRK
jgi:ferritin-like metal-binding protein YciE